MGEPTMIPKIHYLLMGVPSFDVLAHFPIHTPLQCVNIGFHSVLFYVEVDLGFLGSLQAENKLI